MYEATLHSALFFSAPFFSPLAEYQMACTIFDISCTRQLDYTPDRALFFENEKCECNVIIYCFVQGVASCQI